MNQPVRTSSNHSFLFEIRLEVYYTFYFSPEDETSMRQLGRIVSLIYMGLITMRYDLRSFCVYTKKVHKDCVKAKEWPFSRRQEIIDNTISQSISTTVFYLLERLSVSTLVRIRFFSGIVIACVSVIREAWIKSLFVLVTNPQPHRQ